MKKPSKNKVSDFIATFEKLPEASQDKLLCVAYGMQLADGLNMRRATDDRETDNGRAVVLR